MTSTTGLRSTAEAQRARLTSAAVRVFAEKGYHATPVAEVAAAAGVSPAYAFRLFGDKLGLFVAAVHDTYSRVAVTMSEAGETCESVEPSAKLAAMTDAYVALIADRDLILLQSHAQATSSIPAVRIAVQDGLANVVTAVTDASHAAPEDVQRFVAYGQLCHLIVQADLAEVAQSWAATLTAGIKHAP